MGEGRRECDEKDGRKITEAKPQDEKRRISQPRNRIADADERQEKILGPAVPADDDSKPNSEQRGEQECEQQTKQCVKGVEGKNSVGGEANEGGSDRFDARKKFLWKRPEKRERLPGSSCHDEGKDKLRKGDKPSSHFGRRLSDDMVLCNLGRMLFRLLKKTHMLRCARPISRQRTRRVRLRSSIFARLASEIFLSSLQREFFTNPPV
jgi:hypothetical protein